MTIGSNYDELALASKGRLLFLVMAPAMVTNFVGWSVLQTFNWFRGISGPFTIVYLLLSLWAVWNLSKTGDPVLRVYLGVVCFFEGVSPLSIFDTFFMRVVEIATNGAPEYPFQWLELLWLFPVTYSIAFIAFGVLLLFSPSMRVYFRRKRSLYRSEPISV